MSKNFELIFKIKSRKNLLATDFNRQNVVAYYMPDANETPPSLAPIVDKKICTVIKLQKLVIIFIRNNNPTEN